MNFISYFSKILFFALLAPNYASVSFGMDLDIGDTPKAETTQPESKKKKHKNKKKKPGNAGAGDNSGGAGVVVRVEPKKPSPSPTLSESSGDSLSRESTPSPLPSPRRSPFEGGRRTPKPLWAARSQAASPINIGRLTPAQQALQAEIFKPTAINHGKIALELCSALQSDEKKAVTILSDYRPDDIKKVIYIKDEHGWAAIHYATVNARLNALKELLTKGADINDITDNGNPQNPFAHQTPLSIAARTGLLHIVKYLVEFAPKILKTSAPLLKYTSNNTVFDIIVEVFKVPHESLSHAKKDEIVKFLVEQKDADLTTRTADGFNYLDLAVFHNHSNLIPFFLSKGFALDQKVNKSDCKWHGATALHIAAQQGHLEAVEKLVECKAPVNQPDAEGRTPLHLALEMGRKEVAQFLIDRGADVTRCSNNGMSCLHRSAGHSSLITITQHLLEKKIPMTKDKSGFSPVHDAALKDAADIMALFIEAGYNLDEPIRADNKDFEVDDAEGYNPLLLAADRGSLGVVKLLLAPKLLENKKVTVNYAHATTKYTPLLAAFCNGHLEIASCLLAAGADIRAVLADQSTALHSMAQHDANVTYLEQLLQEHPELNRPDKKGIWPLHYAAYHNACKNIAALAKVTNVNEPIEADDKASQTPDEGKTALILAAEQGHVGSVTALLDTKTCEINKALPDGITALHAALIEKHEKIAELLISRDADIKAATNTGTTALHLAVRGNLPRIVEALVRAGIPKNSKNIVGETPLHFAAMWNALGALKTLCSVGGDIGSIDRPVKAEIAENKDAQFEGASSLMIASRFNARACMEFLIRRKADVNYISSNGGFYPLYYAAENGHAGAATLLLKCGARILMTKYGYTALDVAAYNGHINIINLFIDHFAALNKTKRDILLPKLWVDEKNPKNRKTPLLLAAEMNRTDVVELLLQTGIDVKAKNKNNGWNALHYAASHGNDRMVMMLLTKDPTLLNTETYESETPLFIACQKNRPTIVAMLHEAFKVAIDAQRSGSTALSMAVDHRCHDTVECLLKGLKADPNKPIRKGFCALHCAAAKNDVKSARLLLEHKALVSVKNRSGVQPIHTAACHGHKEMLDFLINEAKVPVDEEVVPSTEYEFNFFTPLMMAVFDGKIAGVCTLLRFKANVHHATRSGTTSLHIAMQKGFVKITRILCEHGANPLQKDKDGKTPLDLAPGHKKHELIEAIEQGSAVWQAKSTRTVVLEENKDGEEPELTEAIDEEVITSMNDADLEDDGKEAEIFKIMTQKARKQLKVLDEKTASLIKEKIHHLLTDAKNASLDIKKLTDRENLWRLKVGRDLPRVIYHKDPKTNEVIITEIGARKNIYNKV